MSAFATRLLAWYGRRRRDLPWRATRDPYRIWVSEIMLQQTRAQAVIPYYRRFLERFPDAAALAAAPEPAVLACWSGLGYYSRARNLHRAARRVAEAGAFPSDYEALGALPGVGPYTAAAIASIAFGLPHAVLDGNVLRVIARLEDDHADISSARTRRRFQETAERLLDPRRPGAFNQAMMELGATVCLPRAPLCPRCPVRGHCLALASGAAAQLPVKLGSRAPQRVEASAVVVRRRGRVLLWQRPEGAGRMAGFWELPAAEQLPGLRTTAELGVFRHSITHYRYEVAVLEAGVADVPAGMRWFRPAELAALPLSTTARKALRMAGSGELPPRR